jgi:hypothetical protein
MTNERFPDPNDLLWSDDLVSIVNNDVRRMLRLPVSEPSDYDARIVKAPVLASHDGESRLRTYVSFEYEMRLPESKEPALHTILTEELGFERVPPSPDSIPRWEYKAFYRRGSPERFVQMNVYFVPDEAFKAQREQSSNQTL